MGDWRPRPGFYSAGHSDFESVHVLLGRFLADRSSEDPLPDLSLLRDNPSFSWAAVLRSRRSSTPGKS